MTVPDALDPRPFMRCGTCLNFGMLETAAGDEDSCPTCEGGVWRERMPWRTWLARQVALGWRVRFRGRRPVVYRDFSP